MTPGFFPADPPADPEPIPERPERRPSFEPSEDELPVPFALAEVLARGEDVVLVLTGARVFSDGVEFLVERYLRRGEQDERTWQARHQQFAEHWSRGALEPDRLRWGLGLGDGERVFAEDRFGMPAEAEEGGYTLRLNGGGGGGGSRSYTSHHQLWLHPLPPEGPLEFVVQWPAFGIPESRVLLDGGRLRALAAEVRPLWD